MKTKLSIGELYTPASYKIDLKEFHKTPQVIDFDAFKKFLKN